MGTPDVALPVLDAVVESHDVVGVLTRSDARVGRGRKLRPSDVAQRAEQLGLPVVKADRLRDDAVLQQLADLRPDVAVVVAYGALIPQRALDMFPHGWLNLHFSLLPRWRGAAPVQRAIAAGDSETGVSVFQIEAGLDTGDVFAMRSFSLPLGATAGQVLGDLAQRGAGVILEVLSAIEDGSAVAVPQSCEGVTLAPKLAAEDVLVDFSQPREVVLRRVAAVSPAPGARSSWRGSTFKVGPLKLADSGQQLEPGELLASKREVLVGCGDGALMLGQVAPAGKSWMDAAAWARGAHLGLGERLGATAGE